MKERIQLPRWTMLIGVIAAIGIGGVVGWIASARMGPSALSSGQFAPVFLASLNNQTSDQVSFVAGFTPVVRSATAAVVNISSSRIIRASEGRDPAAPFLQDPFREFFGIPFGPESGVPRERSRKEHWYRM